jgi:hypothetical protein
LSLAARAVPTVSSTLGRPLVSGVTWRSVLLCLLLIPLNARWVALTETVWYAGFPTTISLFYNVVFIVLAVTLLNSLVRWLAPRIALTQPELLTIYTVLCLTSTMVSHDMLQVLTPMMTYAYQYATPENEWASLFHRMLPNWLMVDGHIPGWLGGGTSTDPLRYMYEGGSSLYHPSIWKAWVVPVAMWSLFCGLLYMATLATNSLFRRRWVEAERLTFPIVQLPFELTKPGNPIFRGKAFWVACLIIFAIDIMNGLHVYYAAVPQIPLTAGAAPSYNIGASITDVPWTALRYDGWRLGFYPVAIGLCLLLPTELALSCWVFHFVFKLMRLGAVFWGVYNGEGMPYISDQSFAAYIGLAAFAIWTSRSYLKEALRSAFGKEGADESGEPMRYRTAFILLAVGFAGATGFGVAAGMAIWYAVPFFLIYLVLSFSVSRIRAEMGLPAHDLHGAGPGVMLERLIGRAGLSARTQTATEVFSWFNRAYRAHPAPHQIEGYKLAERTGARPRPLAWLMAVAIPLGAVAAFWALLHYMYRDGVAARFMEPKVPLIFGSEPWDRLATNLNDPAPRQPGPTIAVLGGFVATFAMMAMTVRSPWWPVHPAGYAVSSSWAMGYLWCPMLIAWAVKSTVARYGGNRAYRGLVPIAFGLIMGDLAGGCLWSLYALFVRANPAPYCIWGR